MKKLDGRSKEARAKKVRAEKAEATRARNAYPAEQPDIEPTIGGVGISGDTYIPLDLSIPLSAFDTQRGGEHYKQLAIQPMLYSFKNKLDPAQHTAIKYITRFRSKGGREDLEKAKHVIDLLIEMEYGS